MGKSQTVLEMVTMNTQLIVPMKNLKILRLLYNRNFENTEYYKDLWTCKNQLGRFFCTAKMHKFDSLSDITVDNLKLRPIIDHRSV